MNFVIEQLAIRPRDPVRAKALLAKLGLTDWIEDRVRARGEVFGLITENVAQLSFNYQALEYGQKPLEFEILDYEVGDNWLDYLSRASVVSHLGMHVDASSLENWRRFFEDEGIDVAQDVVTLSHENPAIAGKRWYRYVIFDTRDILGVDLKFIVRLEKPE